MGKNQVTLTFAGDTSNLEGAFDRVGSSAKSMGRSADDSASRIDRLGETGGTTETRFLGLGAGISGVSTLMSGDAGPEDYAMAMADLGDAVEHTVAPLLAQGKQIVANGVNAVVSAGQHVAAAARVVAGWVLMGIQSTINAAKMAAAWLISLGPIGLAIAAVGAVIAILVALGVGFDDLKRWAETAWSFILGAIQSVWNWVSANWPLLLGILTGPIGWAVLAITSHWDTIKSGFSGVKDWIGARVGDIINFFASIPGAVTSAFSSLGSSLVNGIKSLWNNTVGGFGFDVPGWVPLVGGKSFKIPKLHQGGIMPGAPGTEGLALLQAGERVTRAGASAQTVVNVYVQGSIRSDRDLIQLVRDEFGRGGFGGVR